MRLRPDLARPPCPPARGVLERPSCGSCSEDGKEFTATHHRASPILEKRLVDGRGFEPPTLALQTRCSPIELPAHSRLLFHSRGFCLRSHAQVLPDATTRFRVDSDMPCRDRLLLCPEFRGWAVRSHVQLSAHLLPAKKMKSSWPVLRRSYFPASSFTYAALNVFFFFAISSSVG